MCFVRESQKYPDDATARHAFAAARLFFSNWDQGLADELIMPQGTVNYYNSVVAKMGGLSDVQGFYRLYLVPGAGHGDPNGTSNPGAAVPYFAPTQFYDTLTAWVEQGKAPEALTLQSPGAAPKTRPICVYPKKIAYTSGDAGSAASYTCS